MCDGFFIFGLYCVSELSENICFYSFIFDFILYVCETFRILSLVEIVAPAAVIRAVVASVVAVCVVGIEGAR